MQTDRSRISLGELNPRRVCLIKPSALGDVIHALPVLSSLRDRWPSARFSWVINRGLAGLIEGHPALDEVIPFDRAAAGIGPRGLAVSSRFLLGLRRRKFDLAIDLQGLFRSGLMTYATGASIRVGRSDSREGASAFYTHRIGSVETHAIDRLLGLPAAFGADVSSPKFELVISEEDRKWAQAALHEVPRPILVLNPGARWLTKRWPPAHFAEIARRAVARYGAGIVVVGAEEDRPLASAIVDELRPIGIPVRELTGQTTLMGLAAVASASDLFLSNDTGPLHVAVASGARVIAVFTCTDPEKTGPYGAGATVVKSGIWCAGSCVKKCSRLECMTELSADRVWPAVSQALRDSLRKVA